MKKFEEEYDKFHKENHNMHKTATEYHKALKRHFKDVMFLEDYQSVKDRLKECEDLRIEANNKAAKEYTLKCEVVEERAELKREIEQLKSQLEKQQPEIPEVPPFVADCLALIESNNYMISHEQVIEHKEAIVWLEEHQSELMLAKCLLYGYTVEKQKNIVSPCPVCRFEDVKANFCGMCGHKNEYVEVVEEKRFYLKHKSVLIFDPDSDDSDVDELYLGAGGNFVPYQHLAKIFTQSQIDSMETGSYEQIEVQE